MEYKKKLIEVALPLEAINNASKEEKAIRYGLPATLHRWWARRPLAAARAVIFSSLVDDPSSKPDEFPTEEVQSAERQRLFGILERLVKWENSNNADVLAEANAEIMKSTGGNPPALLDPFAGGGAIPLEAQRLGLEAHASDLNPVAVMINKAMIEIPPKFAGQPPVNPEAQANILNTAWIGAQGLAEDVRYYGEWIKRKAIERIGHLYPKAKDEHGQEHTVIAWIWARTVKCPNPACGCEMPLATSFVLSRRKGNEAFVQPIIDGKTVRFEVKKGKDAPESSKTARGANFRCIACGESVTSNYIKSEAVALRMGATLMAIAAEGKNGRLYFSPNSDHISCSSVDKPDNCPTGILPEYKQAINTPLYGLDTFDKLFTNRQLIALITFSELVTEVQKVIAEEAQSIYGDDNKSLENGGIGAFAYAQAVGVYLAMLVDKLADSNNSCCPWEPVAQCPRQLFARQTITMMWDFAEANPLGNSSGSWSNMLGILSGYFTGASVNFPRKYTGAAFQFDAQKDNGMRNILISTDPPYYDSIGYADMSDFFYIWLRKSLHESFPSLFTTLLSPKSEELVAIPFKFGGDMAKAKIFFEDGMLNVCHLLRSYTDSVKQSSQKGLPRVVKRRQVTG